MNLEEMLGIDYSDPLQRQARDLVEADNRLLDDLISARRAKGLTIPEIADRMGVSLLAIERIESGERDPHLSTLRRYALAIGVTYQHEVIR